METEDICTEQGSGLPQQNEEEVKRRRTVLGKAARVDWTFQNWGEGGGECDSHLKRIKRRSLCYLSWIFCKAIHM